MEDPFLCPRRDEDPLRLNRGHEGGQEPSGFQDVYKKLGVDVPVQFTGYGSSLSTEAPETNAEQLSTCGTALSVPEETLDQLTSYGTMPVPETPMEPLHSFAPMREVQPDQVCFKQTRISRRTRVAEKSLFLLWWPAFLGSCVVAEFGLRYWRHSVMAHTVFGCCLMIASCLFLIAYNGGWSGRASSTFLVVNGVCVCFVATLSLLLGLYCFETYTEPYEMYQSSHHYNDVLPGINPGAHRDAGTIKFAAGSHVAVEHSVGIKNGDYYCVAPIMGPDASMYAGFWAAGMNCCTARGRFQCGDVSDPQVLSGLVVLDENIFGSAEIPLYTKAAEEAAAQFGLSIPTAPIFVQWSSDVEADKDRYFHQAWSFVTSSVAGLFCFMLVVVMLLSAMASDEGFASDYFGVDVEVCEEPVFRKEKRKKLRKVNRPTDPLVEPP